MNINKVKIENFRLLEDISISIDDMATLIVGRNNSGKTSLTEIFYKFLSGAGTQFKFEDFSISTYDKFKESLKLYNEYIDAKRKKEGDEILNEKEQKYQDSVPGIKAEIYIKYNKKDDLSSLAPLIMDLDPNRNDVLIVCKYQMKAAKKFFEAYESRKAKYDNDLIEFLRKEYSRFYKIAFYAVDNQNKLNRCEIEKFRLY